jgi:uncharacterized damage-inducible protein DinB
VSLAIRGLDEDDLNAVPVPGKWSTQQVVIHLADAELALADRIKRVIATDNPTLLAWDENKFAANLHYEDQSAADAVKLIDLTRRQTARILRKLPDEAFQRTGNHSEIGRVTLLDLVSKAVSHLDHHLKFVYEKREKLGKSMW